MKKVYTSAFKAQVALELLKEEKTLTQLTSEPGVGTTVLCAWQAIARTGLASLYERRDNLVDQHAAHEQQLEDRYAEIGRLTTQLNWPLYNGQRPHQALDYQTPVSVYFAPSPVPGGASGGSPELTTATS